MNSPPHDDQESSFFFNISDDEQVPKIYSCNECDAEFDEKKRLTQHQRRVHASEEEKQCPHCGKQFQTTSSVARHKKSCSRNPIAQRPLAVTIVDPGSSRKDSSRKARSEKKNVVGIENYIKALSMYLRRGQFVHTFANVTARNLKVNTINGYVSSVRKALEAIFEAVECRLVLLDEPTEQENEYAMRTILSSINVTTLSSFFTARREANYVTRTNSNTMMALRWSSIYIKYLHTMCERYREQLEDLDRELAAVLFPTSNTRNEMRLLSQELDECFAYLSNQIRASSKEADNETRDRNSHEALALRNKWLDLVEFFQLKRTIDAKGQRELDLWEERMNSSSPPRRTSISDKERATWLRDWVIFSFFTDMPPLRPQNAKLQLMQRIEPPGQRKTNGIYFDKDSAIVQYVTYKNSRYLGAKTIVIPPELNGKLRRYCGYVRSFLLAKQVKPTQITNDERQLDLTAWWIQQHRWLFVTNANNSSSFERIGTQFTDFFFRETGKTLRISVLRKIVETSSSETNNRTDQEALSSSLLHSHNTGRRYYVSEIPHRESARQQEIWRRMQTPHTTDANHQSRFDDTAVEEEEEEQEQTTSTFNMESNSTLDLSYEQQQSLQPNNSNATNDVYQLSDTSVRTFSSYHPVINYQQGDWMCPRCNAHNFARRFVCFKCCLKRPFDK